MDPKLKAELIREGNAAVNARDFRKARELYTQAGYKAGLIRIGDYYMHERRLPLLAYGYYQKAEAADKIADLQRRMIGALGVWLGKDKLKEESLAQIEPQQQPEVDPDDHFFPDQTPDEEGKVAVPVSPMLRQMALDILSRA